MEREQMIDELAKKMCNSKTCKLKKDNRHCYRNCNAYIYATRAIDNGAQLIPEDAVVLTGKEYQKYCAYTIIEPQIKGCMDRELKLEKQLNQSRSETASAVLKDVDYESNGQTIMITNYLRKKYGVEE